MGYDEELAERIRAVLGPRSDIAERKMFGGVAWMVNGNMACGIMRAEHLAVRIDPDEAEAATAEPHVDVFAMKDRKPMRGFVIVDAAGIADDATLAQWVDRGTSWAATLPPK
jgi:TfoX/Sxy family transcriptional regulator of competence genes